ncbi:hypothetical protein AXK60_24930 [Tsukamurella pseudospumae]|uniref:Uncharacterized protein n=1 Tax=Tsukamurella pseudospumae TaxID=239498 RepID=A0A138AJR6_9ACTN|nr:hypothetical protein AXK60_24930 [Tsukamurella pseudospumae]
MRIGVPCFDPLSDRVSQMSLLVSAEVGAGLVHVTASIPAAGTAGPLTVEPKTWERRTVAVPEEVMELLVPVIAAQPNRDGLLWSRPSDGDCAR